MPDANGLEVIKIFLRMFFGLVAIGATLLGAGCGTVGYYAQSVQGQWDILSRSRPIDKLIREPGTPDTVKRKLARVLEIRRFASEALKLPDNGSYKRYADVGRRYAVWNVFAAPEFSLAPKKWCFPIVGCVVYRGYFHQEDAQRYAERLKAQGYDVFVGGVPAYSTLGWFADPLLNTVIHYPDDDLAGLIFHELAHQLIYVKDDSVFNESFATLVELEGLKRWLQAQSDASRIDAYRERKKRDRRVVSLILEHKERLSEVYAAGSEPAPMRARKAAVIGALREEFRALIAAWHGYSRFREWFSGPINNAKFVAVSAYHDLVPAFEALLEAQGGDLDGFYAQVEQLAGLEKPDRDARFAQLVTPRSRNW